MPEILLINHNLELLTIAIGLLIASPSIIAWIREATKEDA